MELTLFQVDAFTEHIFGGNPAAICPLESWPADNLLQAVATENNLSETAFFVKQRQGSYHLRWFTPVFEVDLCGHATLASAHVLFHHLDYPDDSITFTSRSGDLIVSRHPDGYLMNFPADELFPAKPPQAIVDGLGLMPNRTFKGRSDYLAILESEAQVVALKPNFGKIAELEDSRGLIVSAPGNTVDFVSRCFFPSAGIDEDPVTGSAHTTMAPYWANRLGKKELSAIQLSKRCGHVRCVVKGDRIDLIGQAVTYLVGKTVHLESS